MRIISSLVLVPVFVATACSSSATSPGAGSGDPAPDAATAGGGGDPVGFTFKAHGMYDERTDGINFPNDQPMHDHNGMQTALEGAGACPDVYRHAYLLDETPLFGRESVPNPIEYDVASDAGALQYRVLSATGATLLDWTVATSGFSAIALHRDGQHAIPALGDGGELHVEFATADGTTATRCFTLHPLSAPFEVAGATVLPNTAHLTSPASVVAWQTTGAAVYAVDVRQAVAEPLALTFALPAPANATRTSHGVEEWTSIEADTTYRTCRQVKAGQVLLDSTDPKCARSLPATFPDTPANGAIAASSWHAIVLDTASHAVVCDSTIAPTCTLPARTAAEPAAHGYTVALSLELGTIDPFGASLLAPLAIGTHDVAALPVVDTKWWCQRQHTATAFQPDGSAITTTYCEEAHHIEHVKLLGAIALAVPAATLGIANGNRPSVAVALPSASVDAGTADVPPADDHITAD